MAMLRNTSRKVLYGVVDKSKNLIAFGSGGRTSYLSEAAANKALETAIFQDNQILGTNYRKSDFTVIKLSNA